MKFKNLIKYTNIGILDIIYYKKFYIIYIIKKQAYKNKKYVIIIY